MSIELSAAYLLIAGELNGKFVSSLDAGRAIYNLRVAIGDLPNDYNVDNFIKDLYKQ